MILNWQALQIIEKNQFDNMTEHERFRYMLTLLKGQPYGWGEENPRAADCSGTICFALMAACGYRIRTTAHGLYHHIFTDEQPNGIDALFCITRKAKRHGNRSVSPGTVTHVAGYVDKDIVLNAQKGGARLMYAENLRQWFIDRDHDVILRGINHQRAAHISIAGTMFYGADPVLDELFG